MVAADSLEETAGWTKAQQPRKRLLWLVGRLGRREMRPDADVIALATGRPGQAQEGQGGLYMGSAPAWRPRPLVQQPNQAGAYFGWSGARQANRNGDGY